MYTGDAMTKRVAIVVLDGAYSSTAWQFIDFAQLANGYSDTLRAGETNLFERRRQLDHISCDCISLTGQSTHMTEGLPVSTIPLDAAATQYDLVFIAAMSYVNEDVFSKRLNKFRPIYPWLMQQWLGGSVVASLGSGTFVLAEAGLLNHRVATTPWPLEQVFHRSYPAVKLDVSRDITESNRIVCGSTGGIEHQLIIRLIEILTTPQIAQLVSHDVQFDQRYTTHILADGDDVVSQAQYWFMKNLAQRITLADVACRLRVSERTLIRHFNRKLGMTPHTYLQSIRIDAAKILLKETNLMLGKVAERAGYSDVTYFKQVFRENVGVSPTVFRKTPRRLANDKLISDSN
jgi:transcriptional regulator GlxA family with amidase domain